MPSISTFMFRLNRDLQIAVAKQRSHQHVGVDRAGAGFQHDAHIFGEFVAHIGQQRHFFQVDQFGQLFDQLGFRDLIGDFA